MEGVLGSGDLISIPVFTGAYFMDLRKNEKPKWWNLPNSEYDNRRDQSKQ